MRGGVTRSLPAFLFNFLEASPAPPLDEIPPVAIQVDEHRDDPIGLLDGLAHELDAGRLQASMIAPEVIRPRW